MRFVRESVFNKEKHIKVLIAIAVVVFTAFPIAQAAPELNNEQVDVREEQVEIPVEAPKLEPERVVEEAPQPQVVKHPIGCEHYRALLSQYNWNVEVALQVMRAESGCNPNAVGDNYAIRGLYAPSCGLMQIRTLQGRPSCEQLKNPTTNIEWAYKLYRASGWQPWSVCKTKVSCY